ncbi:hypothetical protein BGW39_005142 [Mortierella sp. 14UC]|nr:hypothetical protein BGW39_005142 [Mortierella sp. 14UC]
MDKGSNNNNKVLAVTANKTGWRKKKKGLENVQLKPRRVPKQQMISTKVPVIEEQEVEETNWTWGSATDKPGEEDVTQLERDSTTSESGGLVIEQYVGSTLTSPGKSKCPKHKQRKTKGCKRRRVASTKSCTEVEEVQDTLSGRINDHKPSEENDDPKTSADTSDNSNCKNSGNDDNKEQERGKGTLENMDREQDLAESLALKQKLEEGKRKLEEGKRKLEEGKRKLEEGTEKLERGKTKEKRLRVALEKGLKVQKSLNMTLRRELQKELETHKNLASIKVIVAELEKGAKLQIMVEEQLGLREKRQEKYLEESDIFCSKVAILRVSEAARALPIPSDLQAPAA